MGRAVSTIYNVPMFKSAQQLSEFLEINLDQMDSEMTEHFPVKVPDHFANRIEKGNPNDPLLKQVIPLVKAPASDKFILDPVGDLQKNPVPSLIHKYRGRALLMVSPRCDIHCRYCFRQHFPYDQVKQSHWQEALEEIKQDNSIEEMILSGGDPFTLSESRLVRLIEQIESIAHVTTLRIHSRTPIVAPEKAPQTSFIDWLKRTRLKVVLVVHCNHANELSEETKQLMLEYRQTSMTLLNQCVLLREVNDSVEDLKNLSQTLFAQGILPYYCHLLDKVSGAESYEVTKDQAWQIFDELRKVVPGYLMPRLVEEIAGEPYKKVIY